jgi:hypothetical protein
MPNSITDFLSNGGLAETATPFGMANTPQGDKTALSGMLSGIMAIPKNLIDAAKEAPPIGLRREDFTDIPGAAQPTDRLVDASTQTAMALAGLGAPGAEAGAAGIFGGKLARTANLDKLNLASKMTREGATPSTIWGETGWFRSPTDGKWRFEIPDNKAKMLGHGLDYSREGDFGAGPAEAMYQHPELYEAYPELKNVKLYNSVYLNPKKPNGIGSFNERLNPQELEVSAKDLNTATDVGIHEMQHGVQGIENFARGGNPSRIAYLQAKMPSKIPLHELKTDPEDLYARLAGEVEARNAQVRAPLTPEQRAKIPPWMTMDEPFEKQLFYDPTGRNSEMVRALMGHKGNY